MNKLKLPIWEKALSRAAHAKKRVSEIHKKAKTMLTAFIKPWAGKTKSWISAKAKPVKPYAGKIKAWVSAGLSNIKLTHVGLKQLGILFMLVVFLATGWIGNSDVAASGEVFATTMQAYKVILKGQAAGYVCNQESANIIMDEVLQDAAENYGMEVTLEDKLSFEPVVIAPEKLSTKEELESSFRRLSDINVNAYVIYADGEKLGTLKSEEDARNLLDSIKDNYADDASGLEEVTFKEKVEIVETPVEFHEVQDTESVEAKIREGQETVEEYTVKEGDTFWSISKAFDIDHDELLRLNPDMDPEKLKPGQNICLSYPKSLLNVVTTEVIEYEAPVPFETETREDSSMFKNESKVIQEGKDGLKLVEARLIKVNGIEQDKEVISEKVIKEPVKKIVVKGTKTPVSRGSGKLIWPARGRLTSRYGRRWGRLHKGIDIANSRGTPVYAADSGKVISTGYNGGYGNLVKIDHGGGMVTYYAHLSKIVVSSGSSVSKGQLIGYMGSTGRSTGPHLHFEVRINGSPRNPISYLP